MSEQIRRSEFEIIAQVLAPLSRGTDLAFDLTDDAALIEPRPGQCVVATADALVAGVHFPRDEAADARARGVDGGAQLRLSMIMAFALSWVVGEVSCAHRVSAKRTGREPRPPPRAVTSEVEVEEATTRKGRSWKPR